MKVARGSEQGLDYCVRRGVTEKHALQIISYPHPTLRHQSKPLKRVDAELVSIIRRMFELMYEAKGIGLAANQVDLPLRFFIVNLEGDPANGEELVFINPVVSHPKSNSEQEEGCLSLPGIYGHVVRPKQVRLQAYNLNGDEFNATIDGMLARCVQHELDHLDGMLFIDRMAPSALADLREDLDDFETDFQSKRSTGEVADNETFLAQLAVWEQKYCT